MSKKFDLILWGATGFTGQLTAEYLAKQSKSGGPCSSLKWALAGRNRHKMQDLKERLIEIEPSLAKVVAILEVTENTEKVLNPIVAQTKLVIAAVGPYLLHGTPIVAACVANGVDYVDLTGEAPFHRAVIEQFHSQAAEKGVIVVPSCGFDCIPSDIGALHAASELMAKHGVPATAIKGYFEGRAGASGGTMESVLNIFAKPLPFILEMMKPYYLNDKSSTPKTIRAYEQDQNLPSYDNDVKSWTTKWVMAAYNTRLVRRSIALIREAKQEQNSVFDKDFVYNETMKTPNIFVAFMVLFGVLCFCVMALLSPTRWLLKKFVVPTPGQGQSKQERDRNWFRYTFVARAGDGRRVTTEFSAREDPGYDFTAKMLAETALCILQDKESILKSRQGRGGVLTPMSSVGLRLVPRLQAAGGVIKSVS